MDKMNAREWFSTLEEIIDRTLRIWKKDHIENGEVVQGKWQFEQTHIILDVFWRDQVETVQLQYFSPRAKHSFTWHGLNDNTVNKILDRIGNLAQITAHPPIDPMDKEEDK